MSNFQPKKNNNTQKQFKMNPILHLNRGGAGNPAYKICTKTLREQKRKANKEKRLFIINQSKKILYFKTSNRLGIYKVYNQVTIFTVKAESPRAQEAPYLMSMKHAQVCKTQHRGLYQHDGEIKMSELFWVNSHFIIHAATYKINRACMALPEPIFTYIPLKRTSS